MDEGAASATEQATCLGANIVGAFAIALWATFSTAPLFLILKLIPQTTEGPAGMNKGSLLRVSPAIERVGLDFEFEETNNAANSAEKLDSSVANQVRAMGSIR